MAQFRQFVAAGQTGARVVVAFTDLLHGGHHPIERIHDGAIGSGAQTESDPDTEQGYHRDHHGEGITGVLRGFQVLRGALLGLRHTRQQGFEKGIDQFVEIVADKQIQPAAIPRGQQLLHFGEGVVDAAQGSFKGVLQAFPLAGAQ